MSKMNQNPIILQKLKAIHKVQIKEKVRKCHVKIPINQTGLVIQLKISMIQKI